MSLCPDPSVFRFKSICPATLPTPFLPTPCFPFLLEDEIVIRISQIHNAFTLWPEFSVIVLSHSSSWKWRLVPRQAGSPSWLKSLGTTKTVFWTFLITCIVCKYGEAVLGVLYFLISEISRHKTLSSTRVSPSYNFLPKIPSSFWDSLYNLVTTVRNLTNPFFFDFRHLTSKDVSPSMCQSLHFKSRLSLNIINWSMRDRNFR